jgi:hypothetical protein
LGVNRFLAVDFLLYKENIAKTNYKRTHKNENLKKKSIAENQLNQNTHMDILNLQEIN